MTKQTLEKLPENIKKTVEQFRKDYKALQNNGDMARIKYGNEYRARMAGYAKGLADAGLITEKERQILFCYMTV